MVGGPANDQLHGGAGADAMGGEGGQDSLEGGDGKDALSGGPGDDTMLGQVGNDFLEGDDGNDTLDGYQGRDLLIGGNGSDYIYGDVDDDILIGGTTGYDANNYANWLALDAIMKEWTSSRTLAQRSYNISGGTISSSNTAGTSSTQRSRKRTTSSCACPRLTARSHKSLHR